MPQLDPVLHNPSRTGPSRDYKAIAAKEPQYRQEAFQMMPKRLHVDMSANMRPRPLARSGTNPDTGLAMARIPVLIRQSNQRPQEAGESGERGNWSLSDPSQPSGMMPGMGESAVAEETGKKTILIAGVAIGLAAWFLLK